MCLLCACFVRLLHLDVCLQVIDHPSAYNVRLHRAVIMMTTNIGTDWALRFSKELLTRVRLSLPLCLYT